MRDEINSDLFNEIARIEGGTTKQHEGYACCFVNEGGLITHIPFNPLEDGLNHRLMIKHDINLTSIDNVYEGGRSERYYTCFEQGAYQNVSAELSTSKDPNMAVVLAIIAKFNATN